MCRGGCRWQNRGELVARVEVGRVGRSGERVGRVAVARVVHPSVVRLSVARVAVPSRVGVALLFQLIRTAFSTNVLGTGNDLLFKALLGYLNEPGDFDEKEQLVRGVINFP